MTYFIAGLVAVIVLSGMLERFTGASPKWLSQKGRKLGGVVALAAGILLLGRGQLELGVPVTVAGLSLLGWSGSFGSFSLFGGRQDAVKLFTDGKGRITGRFTTGPYAGRSLDALTREQLVMALDDLDAENASRLEAYLDRRHSGWRRDPQGNAHARSAPAARQTLTEQEAYEVLGLQPGADEEAIRQAHRTLMKKIHPDQGGSTYLAARVNMAKDLLLERHGRNS